jgi:hypothetical protein
MVERRDVDFEVEGGDRLRGWLFQPDGKGGPLRGRERARARAVCARLRRCRVRRAAA